MRRTRRAVESKDRTEKAKSGPRRWRGESAVSLRELPFNRKRKCRRGYGGTRRLLLFAESRGLVRWENRLSASSSVPPLLTQSPDPRDSLQFTLLLILEGAPPTPHPERSRRISCREATFVRAPGFTVRRFAAAKISFGTPYRAAQDDGVGEASGHANAGTRYLPIRSMVDSSVSRMLAKKYWNPTLTRSW